MISYLVTRVIWSFDGGDTGGFIALSAFNFRKGFD
jgi:hypothetical protein